MWPSMAASEPRRTLDDYGLGVRARRRRSEPVERVVGHRHRRHGVPVVRGVVAAARLALLRPRSAWARTSAHEPGDDGCHHIDGDGAVEHDRLDVAVAHGRSCWHPDPRPVTLRRAP